MLPTARLLRTLLLRLLLAIGTVVIVAFIALTIPRLARPDLYVGETGLGGVWHAMGRAFLHFDFGTACTWVGCPKVRDMWSRGYVADVSMLFGTIAIGVGGGFAVGLWCAGRWESRRARVVERAAALLYCAPVYAVGFGALLMFHATFGLVHVPYFFDAAPVWASPFSEPWDWFRTLLVPCIVTAAPLAAMCLRLVVALVREQVHADHVRTAIAKGVPHRRVIHRHAGPYARIATASLVSVSAPIVVTNLILVERVFNVPGFFVHTWRASGHTDSFHKPAVIDWEMLVGITIWASVFVVTITFVMDAALSWLDPRIAAAQQSAP
jgi:ABC-type dipeptide/oligopeptide/nickel transport system permease component